MQRQFHRLDGYATTANVGLSMMMKQSVFSFFFVMLIAWQEFTRSQDNTAPAEDKQRLGQCITTVLDARKRRIDGHLAILRVPPKTAPEGRKFESSIRALAMEHAP